MHMVFSGSALEAIYAENVECRRAALYSRRKASSGGGPVGGRCLGGGIHM